MAFRKPLKSMLCKQTSMYIGLLWAWIMLIFCRFRTPYLVMVQSSGHCRDCTPECKVAHVSHVLVDWSEEPLRAGHHGIEQRQQMGH